MIAEILANTRALRPMVHCITNYVTANDCANLLLACGASPVMSDEPLEVEELAALCGGLVLNLGTPNPRRMEAMLRAGHRAAELGRPVVLDPVGAGLSQLRRDAAQQLLRSVHPAIIRGNADEIRTLACGVSMQRSLDAEGGASLEAAVELAGMTGAVVLMTGVCDIVTDGKNSWQVRNGHPMMRLVTGAGCQLSALTGAFAAANPARPLQAALAAACAMGVCGEIAHERLDPQDGNGSCRNAIIDAVCNLQSEELERRANYEIL